MFMITVVNVIRFRFFYFLQSVINCTRKNKTKHCHFASNPSVLLPNYFVRFLWATAYIV